MNGLSITLLVLSGFFVAAWYFSKDDISCVVSGAEIESINGYYSAYGGIYMKRGYSILTNPDFFDVLNLRKFRSRETPTISFSKHMWTINTNMMNNLAYVNEPINPEKYLYSPPNINWSSHKLKTQSKLEITNCVGSLEDSSPITNDQLSNIGQLLSIPVTTGILVVICAFAYYLWANKVESSLITYSYDAIMNRGEYYKIVTSTLAHTEILHLGFNLTGLYSLGLSLESVYGSVTYLYLSVNLIFFCVFIETFVLYLVTTTGRVDFIHNQSLGYSGVLFAWMVAMSVRMVKFCPIFIIPSFCMATFHIPIPDLISHIFTSSSGLNIPVNIGPFVMLIATKLIIPRSSFLGHLSGILIGYPLAWNLLDWVTPPVMVCILTLCYACKEGLHTGNIPSYADHSGDLSDFVSPGILWNYHMFRIVSIVLVVFEVYSLISFSWFQLLTRGVTVGLLIVCIYIRKVEFVSSLPVVHEICVKLMLCLLVNVTSLLFYDVCSLGATLGGYDLILGSGISPSSLYYHTVYLSALIVVEMICIIFTLLCVYDMPALGDRLKLIRWEKRVIEKDLESLGVMRLLRGGEVVSPFSGQGNRLSSSSSSTTSGNDSGSGLSRRVEEGISGTSMQPMAISDRGAAGGHILGGNGSGSGRGTYANLNRTGTGLPKTTSPQGGRKVDL